MYRLPSASHTCAPRPRTRNGGVPPTERKARTGELTPPGMSRSARVCNARDLSRLRAMVRYSPFGIRSSLFAFRSSLSGFQPKTEEFIRVNAEEVVRKITGESRWGGHKSAIRLSRFALRGLVQLTIRLRPTSNR